MTSERAQRQIDRLLDEAEEAIRANDWQLARQRAQAVLDLDPDNPDAHRLIAGADRAEARIATSSASATPAPTTPTTAQPTSFANGRYEVTRFLGEGGKKRVYLAKDTRLDRNVAFALIKTEGLDEASRVRVQREAEAMGRLGAHPHIVTVFDIGDENGQPYLVLPVLAGGDVEGVIEKAPENKLPLERAVKIGIDTCLGLEFAHSKGIVHRDLKPGNVWLTEDGRAMIGDFGLAVAVDKSRLTQAGMMVGTVNYMPPEQAMGGEVGPRSDLYSLGAMLYEMVCGRPPFVGDESVAIIGQHLNTPPVAPSWHRPDCPQSLEALILRLLEKDPSKRPASATEVREALESVTATAAPRQATIAQEMPVGDNPLYRRTFVGRENEVRQLQQAFDAALSGQGGLVMVVGEPGIGKTALCEQLATYVALRGGKALVGHCYEEGSLSLPYLAFVEAMRSYVLAREPDGLRSDLGTGAADVARIVSEVRDRVQGVEIRSGGDPEDERWRLLQAVTSFLRNASTVQPLCIVLEDLHWADRGTLDLLLHASRNLQGARLLLVGTYRDVEVDRSHPLSNALADLRRGSNFVRVPLRGLSIREVHRMYEAIRGQETALAQAEAVHRLTEGNPLFVQEVLRYLVEEGLVVRQDGRYVPQVDPGVGIPEGLREVVGKRLSRLSAECNRLLAIAAVIGRDFDLQTLRGVADQPEEDLLNSLEEAVRIGVLEERSLPGSVRYRFAHALFRQTLYEEMIAPRRLRLHQEVARALEAQYAGRREDHASELAEHYSQSTDAADLDKAVHYGELAARRAMSVFDYGEAASHLERSLAIQEVLNPDDKQRLCDLYFALGDALQPAGQPLRAAQYAAERGWQLAEEIGDRTRVFRAFPMVLLSLMRYASISTPALPDYDKWLKRLDNYEVTSASERVVANFLRSIGCYMKGEMPAFHELLGDGMAAARGLPFPQRFTANWFTVLPFEPRHEAQRLEMTLQALAWPRDGVSLRLLSSLIVYTGVALLGWRTKAEALDLWSYVHEVAERTRDPSAMQIDLARKGIEDYLEGRLVESCEAVDELMALAEEQGAQVMARTYRQVILFNAFLNLGRYDEALTHLAEVSSILRIWHPMSILLLASKGEYDQARGLLARHLLEQPLDHNTSAELLELLQAAVLLEDQELALELVELLAPVAGVRIFFFEYSSTARHLGAGYALLGRPVEAREHYENGIARCSEIGFRPELALTRLQFAELLLEHYPDEHDAAIEHLDFAITELRDMKMQPALERALRHRGLLKA